MSGYRSYFFDENTKTSESVVLSNFGSNVLITSTQQNVKINKPSNNNVFSIEFKVLNSNGNLAIGIGNTDNASSRISYTGAYTSGVSINYSDGTIRRGANLVTTLSDFISVKNDIVALKVDKTNKKVYFYKNGIQMNYVYIIPFTFTDLLIELGTGPQVNGNLEINYQQVYNYNAPPYFYYNTTLILHDGEYKKWNDVSPKSWSTVSPTLPISQQFLSDGMDSLSPLLDRTVLELEPLPMTIKRILSEGEVGKVFSKKLDLKKYLDIRKIKVEAK